LLPARYALLPGAFLITPQTGAPTSSATLVGGASLASGYRFNDLDPAQTSAPLNALFQISPQSVVKTLAQYDSSYANTFLAQSAVSHNAAVAASAGLIQVPCAGGDPVDGASRGLNSKATSGGLGGLVDISTPVDILIAGPRPRLPGLTDWCCNPRD